MKRLCNTIKGLSEEQEREHAKDSIEFAKKQTEKFRKQNKDKQAKKNSKELDSEE